MAQREATAEAAAEWVDIGALNPWQDNPRHNDAAVPEVAASIRRFGFAAPIVARRADGMVIAGHTRLRAAQSLGLDRVPVRFMDLDPADAKLLAIADNKVGEIAEWDELKLAEILDGLEVGEATEGLGFSEGELNEMLGEPFGDDTEAGGEAGLAPVPLEDEFGVVPFSVLDTRKAEWQARKAEWNRLIGDAGESREDTLFTAQPTDPVSAMLKSHNNAVSILDAVLAETAVRWFSAPGFKCLDPFAGDSVFGCVCGSLSRSFVGIELRQSQAEFNQQRADRVAKGAALYINDDARNLRSHIEPESVDMVFTCPPYADLEVYSDDPADLSTLPHDDFIDQYKEILGYCYTALRENRFAVVVMSEVRGRGGGYIGTVPATIDAMVGAGFMYWCELILVNAVGTLAVRAGRQMRATRKVGRTHQSVLVFYKGDQSKIRNELGDVVMGGGPNE